jgi:ribosomal protein L15
MRSKRLKFGLVISLVFVGLAIAEAQVEKQVRHYKAYKIEPGIAIEITNKYGKIDVETWTKDSVSFAILLKANGKSEEKIQNLFEDIEFNFIKTESRIIAKTVIGNNKNQFLQEITNIASAITSLGVDAEIDYKVKIPSKNPVKLTNSFGDIFIDNMKENTQIYLSHGDLRTGNFSKSLELDIRFGKAYMRDLNDAKINSRYSDLISIQEVNKLKLKSKSSNIEIKKIDYLDIDSKSDEIDIDELSRLKGIASFSKLTIKKFMLEANLNYKFGNIYFENIIADFKNITLETSLTDVSLSFDVGASYTFEMLVKETDVKVSDKLKLNKKLIGSTKDENFKYTGNYGNSSKGSKVKIDAEKGEIIIIQK